MAEHTASETKELAEVFAAEYNVCNGTSFTYDDGRSYQPREPYDFVLYDGKSELGVQLVRAVENPVRDFIRPKAAAKVISSLKELLGKSGLNELAVYLNMEVPPGTDEEAARLAYWLHFFVESKAGTPASKPAYFSYDAHFDEQFLPKINKYVSKLSISPYPGHNGVALIWSNAKRDPEPLFDDEQRVVAAVAKKYEKYKDGSVLILVDAFSWPVSDLYVPIIKQSLQAFKFREVWIGENFATHKRAIRVK